jgi:predicted alpha/beta-fold hydrolase
VQTLLASVGPRRGDVDRRSSDVTASSRDWLIDCGDGVRLLSHLSSHGDAPRDLIILLHGWEGSGQSQYLLSAAAGLFAAGFDLIRLNLRDHGPTHHLNRELFHSCMLEEVVAAVGQIAATIPHRRLGFLGFSLGGNFGLRVALKAPAAGIRLDRVMAVCPVLDPLHTMIRLEKGWVYRRYFEYKWARSLRKKAAAWPEVYDFSSLLQKPTLGLLTRHLVDRYTDFPSMTEYLNGYALVGDTLEKLTVPSLILATMDDPIIPAADLERLARPAALSVETLGRGGHCGFLETLRGPSWADRRALRWFQF